MAITVHNQTNSGQEKKNLSTITHDKPLTATEVTDLKRLLTEEFERHNDITLEFTGLTDCDTLGIQLLVCATKSAKISNSKFEIKGDIDALLLASESIGLKFEDYFNYTT